MLVSTWQGRERAGEGEEREGRRGKGRRGEGRGGGEERREGEGGTNGAKVHNMGAIDDCTHHKLSVNI